MKYYIKEMRVHHYIKNLLIFAAAVFGGQMFVMENAIRGGWGFAAFCMISSVVYIMNDIGDVEKARQHPAKCRRPVAAGDITCRGAWTLAAVLFIASMICNFMIFRVDSTLLLLVYFFLNLGYSFGWKEIPIVDVAVLVSGFLLRILYGAVITEIQISSWLYLTVITLAFYFALGKRRNELRRLKSGDTRKVLQFYTEGFLEKNMYMCLALANTFYALWSMDEVTVWTVPVVLLICMRYSLDVEGDSDGDPVEVLVHDKYLILLCAGYLVIMFVLLYMI